MSRPKLGRRKEEGAYFAAPKSNLDFFSTGCCLLDHVVGGGVPLGRIVNVVGDKSVGKTGQAVEASANFARIFPRGAIRYKEAEAAFDQPYAETLGMPLDRVDFSETENTVEAVFDDMVSFTSRLRGPGFYVLDSLDALSDAAELERGINEGSYGAEKAKKMSQLFRRLVKELDKKQCSVMIISQVRDRIGVSFGKKTGRSGGRALDFYATWVLELTQIKKLVKTVKGVTRPYGVRIAAYCAKNKIALPFRSCEYELIFGYGIDDLKASLEWMKEIKRIEELEVGTDIAKVLRMYEEAPDGERKELLQDVSDKVGRVWYEIEQGFLPKRRKYA